MIEDEVRALTSAIPPSQRHVLRATRRKARILLRARDAREDELADALHRAEARLRRHGLA